MTDSVVNHGILRDRPPNPSPASPPRPFLLLPPSSFLLPPSSFSSVWESFAGYKNFSDYKDLRKSAGCVDDTDPNDCSAWAVRAWWLAGTIVWGGVEEEFGTEVRLSYVLGQVSCCFE